MENRKTEDKTKTFTNLRMWQNAHLFVLNVYQFSDNFPKHELFGLTSQLRRATVSIPANIAEGYKRIGKSDKLRFFNIAQASLEECRYYLILSNDLKYLNSDTYNNLNNKLEDTSKELNSYCIKLANDIK